MKKSDTLEQICDNMEKLLKEELNLIVPAILSGNFNEAEYKFAAGRADGIQRGLELVALVREGFYKNDDDEQPKLVHGRFRS